METTLYVTTIVCVLSVVACGALTHVTGTQTEAWLPDAGAAGDRLYLGGRRRHHPDPHARRSRGRT